MHFVCIFENANTMNKNPLNNETTMKLAAERKWKRIRHKRGAFGLVGIVMVVTLKPISWKNNAMEYIYRGNTSRQLKFKYKNRNQIN